MCGAAQAACYQALIGPQQQQNGWALEWASEETKGDRELCMAAVAQDGKALQWAGEEMKGDRELCMAAVAQYELALAFASKELGATPKPQTMWKKK